MEFPEEFWQGIEQFNRGEYYACHDTLEAIWIEAAIADRKFFQGILQIAVGLYHLGNHNWRGAVISLGEGLNRLQSYPSDYGGVDVEHLIDQGSTLLSELQTLGSDRVAQVVLTQDNFATADKEQILLKAPIVQTI